MMEEKFADIFDEHPELKKRQIVAHTFSNNGIQTWCNVKELLPHPQGFIFDSGKIEPCVLGCDKRFEFAFKNMF